MWLLRPRVVRRIPRQCHAFDARQAVLDGDRQSRRPEFMLREFSRISGVTARSLPTTTPGAHPYQIDIPEKYSNVPRWYLLDNNLDPPRPWGPQTNIPVFSLALKRITPEGPRYLLYAHSPLQDRTNVHITIPGLRKVTVDVPRRGAFFVIDESTAEILMLTGR